MRLSEVLDGGSVTVRTRRFGASRQSVHSRLPKFLASGALATQRPYRDR